MLRTIPCSTASCSYLFGGGGMVSTVGGGGTTGIAGTTAGAGIASTSAFTDFVSFFSSVAGSSRSFGTSSVGTGGFTSIVGFGFANGGSIVCG
jgi:hypothetical protein